MFGGSGASFYVFNDLKRTKKRREKRTPFDPKKRLYTNNGIQHEFPKLTPQMREQIQTQILEDRKRSRRKFLIVSSILAILLVLVSYYLLFEIKITDSFYNLFTFGR